MKKAGNLINPSHFRNEQNQQKFNIKATRPSPTCWEELKLVLDNEPQQNKKSSQIPNNKNSDKPNKSISPNPNKVSKNNNNKIRQIPSKKRTILYFPDSLIKNKLSYNLFGYFDGPINKNNNQKNNQKIKLTIEISFEFHLNDSKIELIIDENELCHFSSPFSENQNIEQEKSQDKNGNQNSYYQMQWIPYYPNLIAHSNSLPSVQYIYPGYSICPQPQFQQPIVNNSQLSQMASNTQEKEEK